VAGGQRSSKTADWRCVSGAESARGCGIWIWSAPRTSGEGCWIGTRDWRPFLTRRLCVLRGELSLDQSVRATWDLERDGSGRCAVVQCGDKTPG
jgi:hypothetical protein